MSKTIDPDMVRHIGLLSRIELSEQEVDLFGEQLGSTLEYFDKLQQLDTENVEPMVHAVEIHNVLADDEPHESLKPEDALKNAPESDGEFFMVPKVLGDSQ